MISLLVAASAGLVVSLVGTPLLIGYLRARGIGQPIREDGPAGHHTKAGTPTMGGLAIVGSALVGYGLAHLRVRDFDAAGITVLTAIVGLALVGFIDDYLSVRHGRNLGLKKRQKTAGQLLVGALFAFLALEWTGVSTHLGFARETGVDLGTALWATWAVLLITGSSNAVNLTDGLDGLASGSGAMVFGAFVVIAFWQVRNPGVYGVPPQQALDLAIVAAAMMGACAGFLWWNAAPAQIFMGDTGSLAIGAGIAALALLTRTHLLLPILAGLYVLETLSVIIQVLTYRGFGRRWFRMAPVHHHFELGGWPEITVIVRFWLIAGLLVAFGLGVFYADFITVPGALN